MVNLLIVQNCSAILVIEASKDIFNVEIGFYEVPSKLFIVFKHVLHDKVTHSVVLFEVVLLMFIKHFFFSQTFGCWYPRRNWFFYTLII